MAKKGEFYTHEQLLASFNRMINKTESCWIWIGANDRKRGYGSFHIKGKSIGAHRVAYEFFIGAIPKGMVVMHKCDNPRCVNPEHLQIGTQKQNIHDMISKGRKADLRASTCKRGHDLTDEKNLYIYRTGRICKLCALERSLKKPLFRRNVPKIFKKRSHIPCVICSKTPTDRSHVKTEGSGGIWEESNIIQLCRPHHIEQHKIGIVTFTKKYPSVEDELKRKGWKVEEIFGQMKLVRV